jgi:hypothetical protein
MAMGFYNSAHESQAIPMVRDDASARRGPDERRG